MLLAGEGGWRAWPDPYPLTFVDVSLARLRADCRVEQRPGEPVLPDGGVVFLGRGARMVLSNISTKAAASPFAGESEFREARGYDKVDVD
jgi:hypothetical protein